MPPFGITRVFIVEVLLLAQPFLAVSNNIQLFVVVELQQILCLLQPLLKCHSFYCKSAIPSKSFHITIARGTFLDVLRLTRNRARNSGLRVGRRPPANFLPSPGKLCWTQFKTNGHG